MIVSSMTGFSRAQGRNEFCSWTWEIKSVNGRGLDARCRVPNGFDHLDPPIRERVGSFFKRGNISLNLSLQRGERETSIRINRTALEEILNILPELKERVPGAEPPTLDGIFGLRGVIESVDEELSDEDQSALDAALLESLEAALSSLKDSRQAEGARLAAILAQHLDEIGALCEEAEGLTAMHPETIRERLRKQVAALVDEVPGIPEERLAQEAALLMTKADPREELDRLKAHLEAARGLLAESQPTGRRLDFLCQEFNREANTLCSKAADVDLTRTGLALKAVIDQLREQVQNIE
ncbi:MAG: YicC family protein [Rhodospirillales bacterium]|nr:YicC family protein [Rhodospirillales bacterium]